MLKRFINRTHRDQKGITGLETAIILIAFVVVAAVFAFTALSAGLFSTEKSKEAVYSGLQEAQSCVELKGDVTTNSVQALNTMDAVADWTSSNVRTTIADEPVIKMEGANSLKVGVVVLSQNDYVYAAMTTPLSFTTLDTISFWVRSSTALTHANDVVFYADTDNNPAGAVTLNAGTMAANTWTYVSGNLSGSVTNATFYGFQYKDNTIRDIYIDMIQAPVPVYNRTDVPVTYVNSVDFTVVSPLGGEPIDFALPTDSNNDGVLTSADNSGVKTNYLTIAYDDIYQQVNDLAWTVTRIVGDNDYLLEQNEIFKVTVDLKAVNLGVTGIEKLGTNHAFTLEVKPAQGAVLQISKTTPQVLNAVDDLN